MGEIIVATYKDMTQEISDAMYREHGVRVDPEAIWTVDRHGEIWPIHALHAVYVTKVGTPYAIRGYIDRLLAGVQGMQRSNL